MSYYPVMLQLDGQRCVVVGGGAVAAGKVDGLLAAGARVTVIAPDLVPPLQQCVVEGQVDHLARGYWPGDLAGASLVVAATDDRQVNARVADDARRLGLLFNAVDDVDHCNFIAPSVLRRGDLTIAISTSGRAPALAVRLKEQLDPLVGEEHARFLQLAADLRQPLAARQPDFARRKALWYRLVDSDVLDLLRRGDEAGARRRIAEITGITLPATTSVVAP
jgi:siroheme synthase-like protein